MQAEGFELKEFPLQTLSELAAPGHPCHPCHPCRCHQVSPDVTGIPCHRPFPVC